jgi:rhamnosyltransferase
VYVIARARGWKWRIDGEPTVDYRQHDANVIGSNTGSRAALRRLGMIRNHWHRDQAVLLATIATTVADPGLRPAIERVRALLTTRGIRSRWELARLSSQLRRRPRDRKIIGVLIASGVW